MEYSFHDESHRVLVVDDEKVIREILSDFLTMEGYIVHAAEDGQQALAELEQRAYNLVITDLKMPKMGGLELLEEIDRRSLNVLTVIMTGFGTVETAIEAMKKGAYDYILKPFKVEEVIHIVQRGLEKQRLQMENIQLKEALSIYTLSDKLNRTLSLEHILEIIVDTALRESHADVTTLLLRAERTGQFEVRLRRAPEGKEPAHKLEALNLVEILEHYREDRPVLYHGNRATRFFTDDSADHPVCSIISVPLKIRLEIIGMLNVYSYTRGRKFAEGQRKMLSILADRASSAIDNAQLFQNLQRSFQQTIQGFARAMEAKDPYTHGHSDRVMQYARLITRGLGLDKPLEEKISTAALMHDIGKIGIPLDALNKPQKLTREEYELFKEHPDKGRRILEPLEFLRDIVPAIYHHHEQFDGTGYPLGLRGEEIPLDARILAVADTYDAMTSDRAYRKALSHEIAVAELRRCAGTQFDPRIVAVFIIEMDKWRKQKAAAAAAITTPPACPGA
ncbi:MAG TPA: response regulator [Myxococcota bacterium]|nr:response regulator [Myxococcota bacterium]HRY94220.1 response regulator [Myxococcota bacterium]